MPPPVLEPVDLSLLTAVEESDRVSTAPADLLRLLYRQVRSLAGPRRELDDLVQMAAERALRSLPRFEGRSALSTWTYGIAYRTVLDHDRWFRRWARRFSFADGEDAASDWDGERASLEIARARRLHTALAKLPPAKRAVVVLHDLEGMELKEVAGVVGANERTVRSRLRDARKKLVELLSEDPLFDAEAAE
jgi:RNA polymerase sigma-70 factor (ECF subfamily)